MIKIGTSTLNQQRITIGATEISKVYVGSNLVWTKPVAIAVGDSYQGGIVAYIFVYEDAGYVSGEIHGLIAAPSDQGTGIQWYNGSYTTTGVTATAIGYGYANTNAIVAYQGTGSYAAKLCYDLSLGGYTDWWLPSKDELHQMYVNRVAIGGFTLYHGYWSSSQVAYNTAWYHDFASEYEYDPNMANFYDVRAVRSF